MIDPADLKIEAEAHPPGGQHVGMLSGVWVTHTPTGLRAFCSSERSQHKNKAVALDMIAGGLTSPHFR